VVAPDILTYDTSSSAGFLNGRQFSDDVIDAELNLEVASGRTGVHVQDENTFSWIRCRLECVQVGHNPHFSFL